PVDPTAYTALTKDLATTPQMYILGWCADYPDPQNWLSTVFKTGGIGAGRIGYSNPEFDRLVDEADRTPPGPEREQLYSQAQEILIEDAPVVFFWNNPGRIMVKPYVKGITEETVTPLDYIPGFFNLQNIEVAP
ncbi:MAG: peptide ABC transporter substrate-binding protein, partial [Chloroflexota bacterium]|nr:peptide ABC transporter substrate-binding protein [Chloroflexota bacterium]